MRGFSDANGSWKTICSLRRMARSSRRPSARRSWPSKRISPASGSIRRSARRARVDLPQPDSPTRPSVSPASSSSVDVVDRDQAQALAEAGAPDAEALASSRAARAAAAVSSRDARRSEAAPGCGTRRGLRRGRPRVRIDARAHVLRARAALAEAAAGRPRDQVGHAARDHVERLAGPCARRGQRVEQSARVRVLRRAEDLARRRRSRPRGRRRARRPAARPPRPRPGRA